MSLHRTGITLLLLTCLVGSLGISGTARADLMVIVHPKNPVNTLTEDDVRQIFLGRMRLFPATQRNIDPVDLDSSMPGFVSFYRRVARLSPPALQRLRAMYLFGGKGLLPKVQADEADVIQYVSQHPDAIGYVHRDQVTPAVKGILLIKE
jgi:ABC-type phosphate transport system substrate-binding protein